MVMIPQQIKRLVDCFRKLPGIGPKSAERLAFHLLKQPGSQLTEFAQAFLELRQGITLCSRCCHLSSGNLCVLCENSSRDQSQVCIVEESRDVFVLENTGVYKGLYHVLHGAISPLDGIGPEKLTIERLLKRFSSENIQEIILATNPTVSGEATAAHLSRLLKPRGIRVTHLAQGIPMGGVLEFADPDTLRTAIRARREYA